LNIITGSKGNLGQPGGGRKSGRKPPKIAAQGAVTAAPVLAALV